MPAVKSRTSHILSSIWERQTGFLSILEQSDIPLGRDAGQALGEAEGILSLVGRNVKAGDLEMAAELFRFGFDSEKQPTVVWASNRNIVPTGILQSRSHQPRHDLAMSNSAAMPWIAPCIGSVS